MSSVDRKLLEIFDAEQREHVERMRTLLGPPGATAEPSPAVLEELLRRAHTLKGAARAAGFENIEGIAHRMETVLARIRSGAAVLDRAAQEDLHSGLNAAEDAAAAVLSGPPRPDVPAGPPVAGGSHDLVRVDTVYVDDLVRASSQMLAAAGSRSRAGQHYEAVWRHLREIEREWARLRGAIAAHLPRDGSSTSLSEAMARLESGLRNAARETRATATAHHRSSWTLERLAADVYAGTCRIRLTPADSVFGGFRKMVRESAADAGKDVDFQVSGMDVQADRLILQALKDPVMHLLRNAVAHGIESPAERAAAGKADTGSVRLALEARAGRLRVTVADDGRGIDFARILEIAASKGLLPAGAAPQDADLAIGLLFAPGFSTASSVTTLAGRGMGLSVVERQVAQLQGRVDFRVAESGAGVMVVITVPLSISLHHVLIVDCSGRKYAFPSAAVERLVRVSPGSVESVNGEDVIRLGMLAVPVARLAHLLDLPVAGPPAGPKAPTLAVAVLKRGDARLAVIVDAFADAREAVIKDIGLAPDMVGLATGAVALDDGGVAVVLHPGRLMGRFRESTRIPALEPVELPSAKPPGRILVVDDSITTRSLERSILEAHGYEVILAVDGVEGLQRLRGERADLIIADVTMPRMGGFEMLQQIKNDPQLAAIPVIMVTSLEEDRERGLALGADAYIVKSKFDQRELLDAVRQFL